MDKNIPVSEPIMRTFLAIEFSSSIHQQLEIIRNDIRGHLRSQNAPDCLRWSPLHNTHLTLRFLGETTAAQAQTIATGLHEAASNQQPFTLTLGTIGGFPKLKSPRVLWLGIKDDLPQLQALQSEIEQMVQLVGFPAERRAYTPHVTLARASKRATKSDLQQIGRLLQGYVAKEGEKRQKQKPLQMHVDEVVHMQSTLQTGGSIYTSLATFRLNNRCNQRTSKICS